MMDSRPLSRFEAVAQRLVEGTFGRLLGERALAREVAIRLTDALEESVQDGVAANVYRLNFHPDDFATARRQRPDLEERLAHYVRELTQEMGLRLAGPIQVVLEAGTGVPRRRIRVTHAKRSGDDTVARATDGGAGMSLARLQALDAFLIVNGRRHVPLDKAVLTIGRRMNNDVIVDSPVISRNHALLRWRYGRFVLYDAGSRGGVAVNGQPCSECVLQPGDLITLSGQVNLIYGEGLASRDELPAGSSAAQDTLALRPDELTGDSR